MSTYSQKQIERLVEASEGVAAELTEIFNSTVFFDDDDEDMKRISESLDELDASLVPFQH